MQCMSVSGLWRAVGHKPVSALSSCSDWGLDEKSVTSDVLAHCLISSGSSGVCQGVAACEGPWLLSLIWRGGSTPTARLLIGSDNRSGGLAKGAGQEPRFTAIKLCLHLGPVHSFADGTTAYLMKTGHILQIYKTLNHCAFKIGKEKTGFWMYSPMPTNARKETFFPWDV